MISATNVQHTCTHAPAGRVPVNELISESDAAAIYAAFLPWFRPNSRGCCRGPASDRGGDNRQALSVNLRKGYFDFVTGDGGDVVAFVMRAEGVDFRAAVRIIENIIGRTLIDPQSPKPTAPRFTPDDLARAELFRVGLLWRIERELQTAKLGLWSDDHEAAAAKTRALTAALNSALTWSAYEAAVAMKRSGAGLVAECITEAREAQTQLAYVIAGASVRDAA